MTSVPVPVEARCFEYEVGGDLLDRQVFTDFRYIDKWTAKFSS